MAIWKSMGRIIPYMKWKIKFMFETTNQYIYYASDIMVIKKVMNHLKWINYIHQLYILYIFKSELPWFFSPKKNQVRAGPAGPQDARQGRCSGRARSPPPMWRRPAGLLCCKTHETLGFWWVNGDFLMGINVFMGVNGLMDYGYFLMGMNGLILASWLVVLTCFNPSEKYESDWMIIPNIWKNKKWSKPPTR